MGKDDLFDPETGKPLSREEKALDLFDPETGEPLNQEGKELDLFDPETGEPLNQEGKEPDLFDPETGEPLNQEGKAPDLFDPETGEPLVRGEKAPDLFDPETGKPLNRGWETPDLFDPETGKMVGAPGKGKSKKTAVVCVAAACACVAIAAVAMGGLSKKPKDIVSEALTEIVKNADQGFLEDTFGLRELRKQAAGGSVRMGGSVKVEDLPMIGTLGSGSGSLEFCRDTGNQAVQLTGTAEIANMELGSLILYMDDKRIAAAVPEFFDPVFTLNYADDLGGQIEDSALAAEIYMEEEDAEMAAKFIADAGQMLTGQKKRFQIKEIYERYKTTTKAAENLKNALVIEKAEDKSFKVEGKEQKCKGYQVTVPKEALADFVKPAGKFLTSDEALRENELAYLTDVITVGYMMNGSHYDRAREQAEYNIDRFLENIDEGGDKVEDFIKDHMDDIDMILYVDKKGHAVSLEMETSVDAVEKTKIKAQFTFAGGTVPTKNMDGTVKISSRGGSVSFSLEKSEKVEKDQYTGETVFRFSRSGATLKLVLESGYDKKDGDFETKLSGISGPMRFTAKLAGAVTDYEKGKSLAVDLDSVNVTGPMINLNMDFMSGSFFIEPLSEKLTAPEGEEFDIVAADAVDWAELSFELESTMRELQGLFNSSYNYY